MELDRVRLSKGIDDTGTTTYFIIVSFFFIGVWVVIDFIRQRAYYRQLTIAIEHPRVMQATLYCDAEDIFLSNLS
ncbi:hypothetical protein [Paenibacillus arenosi]|uniref:Uncharacterized protein n=1 Tax=Paenibacillus arenosi TaxID=2774142 RepID=A0ABR9B037_9BACL|nr:hypothetical protein [Paenibacillus arenosi]MBD8499772.1 hypothetical protein [Paenibacillus arenosi]